jgi:hypothetical protein
MEQPFKNKERKDRLVLSCQVLKKYIYIFHLLTSIREGAKST